MSAPPLSGASTVPEAPSPQPVGDVAKHAPLVGPLREMYRRFAKNVAILLGTNAGALVLGLGAFALNARALGPQDIGVLALLQTYAAIISRIFAFDTWQPVITLGATARDRDDGSSFQSIVILGFAFDVVAALAGGLVGLALVAYAAPWLGIGADYRSLGIIFTIPIFLSCTGTAVGVLRLLQKFSALAKIELFTALFLLLGSAYLFYHGAALVLYVALYVTGAAIGSTLTLTAMVRALSKDPKTRFDSSQWRFNSSHFKTLFAFSWTTSLSGTLAVLRQNIDLVVLGFFVSPTAVGLYALAKRVARPFDYLAQAVRIAVLPEFAEMSAYEERTKRVVAQFRKLSLIGVPILIVGCFLIYPLLGWALPLVFGAQFRDATLITALMVFSYGLYASGSYLLSALAVSTGPRPLLVGNLIAFAVQLSLSVPLSMAFGVNGAGAATVAAMFAWLTYMYVASMSPRSNRGQP